MIRGILLVSKREIPFYYNFVYNIIINKLGGLLMTLLLQIILPLIFALYLFTLYRNTTIEKSAFLLAVIIGIFGLENIFQHANLTDHAIYPYWGSLKAVVIILSVVFLFKKDGLTGKY